MSFSDFSLAVASITPKVCCLPYALNNLPEEYHSIAKSISKKFTWDTPTGKQCKKCPNIVRFKTLDECLLVLNQTEINIYIPAKVLIPVIGQYITYKFDIDARAEIFNYSIRDRIFMIDEKEIEIYAKEHAQKNDLIVVRYTEDNEICNEDVYLYNGKNVIKRDDSNTLPKELEVLDEKDEGKHPLYWGTHYAIVNFNISPYLKEALQNIVIDGEQIYTEIKCCDQTLRIYGEAEYYDIDFKDLKDCFESRLKEESKEFRVEPDRKKTKVDPSYKGLILYMDVNYMCPKCKFVLNVKKSIDNKKVYRCNNIHQWIRENNMFIPYGKHSCK